ncbi:MAG: NADH-quinone oxidoreductase subunit NuoF [Anaerolineales bacterium]
MSTFRSLVLVSSDPLSLNRGANLVFDTLKKELERFDLTDEVAVRMVSDLGRHEIAPMVIVYPEATIYGPVKPEDVPHLVEEHLYKGRVAAGLQAPLKELSGRIAWISSRKGTLPIEKRIVLRRTGLIDPENIEDYIAQEGYEALAKVLGGMKPAEVIDEVKKSGLQGRGGAGFPSGVKWGFVSNAPGDKKYVVCNADESEPGTFKDRVVLEGDPHSIVEAMSIAAYAVGANEGYIYIRGEYHLAQQRMQKAIEQAREYGLLGKNILGSDFNFDIHIHSGAGAYICGEETALIESIEGKRGEPRPRPPYPTTHGLWGKPTLVNNVETLANIPPILKNGWQWYRQIGTPSSAGTKVYTILGNVNQTGVIEVPMGITLREVITIYGGGMKDGARFKVAQTGGSSGSIVPASLQDTPMDFESYQKAGVSLGSGALLICDENTCVIDLARVLLNFFRNESCGKCTPCRVGTHRAYGVLERIAEGLGTMRDLEELDVIYNGLSQLSNCGLGSTAGTPLRGILDHYRAEVEAHIKLKVCPSGVCAMSGQVIPA